MFLDNLINTGSTPVLEKVASFTEARHNVLVNNITNFDTVGYKQQDLAVDEFNKTLEEAVAKRASRGANSPLEIESTQNLSWDSQGNLNAKTVTSDSSGILFHDQNNRFVEKQISDMVQNALLHNVVNELLKQQYNGISTAIRGRL